MAFTDPGPDPILVTSLTGEADRLRLHPPAVWSVRHNSGAAVVSPPSTVHCRSLGPDPTNTPRVHVSAFLHFSHVSWRHAWRHDQRW